MCGPKINSPAYFQGFCDIPHSRNGLAPRFSCLEADEGALAWMADVDADRPEEIRSCLKFTKQP